MHSCRYSSSKMRTKVQDILHTYIRRLTRTYHKNPRWSSSRHSYNVTNHSILDVRGGSLRYEPAYLATKYITKKKKRYGSLLPPNYILTICILISKSLCFIVTGNL